MPIRTAAIGSTTNTTTAMPAIHRPAFTYGFIVASARRVALAQNMTPQNTVVKRRFAESA